MRKGAVPGVPTIRPREVMFSRIVVAVQAPDQGALDLVQQLATEGVTEVQVLHLRERELSGPIWYARESGREAGYLIEAAVFGLRMAGIAAAGNVRPAIVDRVAEAILAGAEAFDADPIVLGSPRRRGTAPSPPALCALGGPRGGNWPPPLLGGVPLRVLRRSSAPVIVPPRHGPRRQPA